MLDDQTRLNVSTDPFSTCNYIYIYIFFPKYGISIYKYRDSTYVEEMQFPLLLFHQHPYTFFFFSFFKIYWLISFSFEVGNLFLLAPLYFQWFSAGLNAMYFCYCSFYLPPVTFLMIFLEPDADFRTADIMSDSSNTFVKE